MQQLYLSLARQDARPLAEALTKRPHISSDSQWVTFVRNHDELTLDKLSTSERQEVFDAFGPEPGMQLYGRGLRRRVPPMLDGEPRRIRMVYSLLFSLPGTPALFYGEEIGMGENLDVPGRMAVRTPMQWSPEKNAGFSSGMPWLPINQKFSKVNVETESQDPGSLLNYYKNVIELRQSNDSLRKGDFRFLLNAHADLLVYERSFEGKKAIVILNFAHKDVFIPEGMIEAGRECDFGTHGKKKGILKALEGRIYLT